MGSISGRTLQVAVVIFLVILIILLMRGYIGVTEIVVGITIGIGALVVSTAIDNDKLIEGASEVPDCCLELEADPETERDVRGMGESINFEKVLAQKIRLRARARKGKKDFTLHAHQEACREVLTGLTGLEFSELSASKPRPTGEHVVATKEALPEWYKDVNGEHIYLDLDGWAPEERLAFEYRGPVHDEEAKVRENDRIKEHLAEQQNIKLMVLHYGIPAKLMTRYIYTKLVEWKIPLLHGLPRLAKLSAEQMAKLDWNHPKRLEWIKEKEGVKT